MLASCSARERSEATGETECEPNEKLGVVSGELQQLSERGRGRVNQGEVGLAAWLAAEGSEHLEASTEVSLTAH